MEKKQTFSYKIGWWLEDVKYFLEGDSNIQESLYNLQSELGELDIDEHEASLLNNTISYMMKLSFVIKNNPEKIDKFVKNLQDC